jgi:hypothetical protein
MVQYENFRLLKVLSIRELKYPFVEDEIVRGNSLVELLHDGIVSSLQFTEFFANFLARAGELAF